MKYELLLIKVDNEGFPIEEETRSVSRIHIDYDGYLNFEVGPRSSPGKQIVPEDVVDLLPGTCGRGGKGCVVHHTTTTQ